ncbi:MAG TPA: UbiX family flavin prenyltransferase [Myxococcota bacterium]|nr:UbiX family flavin prenyltransferase [Myxococcota bacterium]HRY94589.1 UbiX family flavin prenyltransferase [Myxococcota bacterium]HSA20329.1 UbiX family flavin prenyltransferase [Myxococcota bacterium]
MPEPRRIVLGLSGASGAPLGVRALELLHAAGCEVHLVVSEAARAVLAAECQRTAESLAPLAHRVHDPRDFCAPIASGSFRCDGMLIAPCSMKSLAGIAHGYADNLLLRAADVCLKERRRLVLVAREAPLSLIHLENMRLVTLAGGIILPPVLGFYTRPASLAEAVDQICGKALELLGVESEVYRRWE